MKRFLLLALCALFALNADARTIYVDASRPNNKGDGRSLKKAKKTIQAAINAAKKGDTILVYPGTYAPIKTKNKKIKIKSVKGKGNTRIRSKTDGLLLADLGRWQENQKAFELVFAWYYEGARIMKGGASTSLTGFTLRQDPSSASKWYGYRTASAVAGGTLRNCSIERCGRCGLVNAGRDRYECGYRREKSKAKTYLVNKPPLVYKSKLIGCTLSDSCGSEMPACLFELSAIGEALDGLAVCASTLTRCKLVANGSHGRFLIYDSKFYNCLIAENEWTKADNCVFANCTIANNPDLKMTKSKARSCIVHGNGEDLFKPSRKNKFAATFTDGRDPKFVDCVGGEYHLASDSPCIDRGKKVTGTGSLDLDGGNRARGTVDMGCYEYFAAQSVTVKFMGFTDDLSDPWVLFSEKTYSRPKTYGSLPTPELKNHLFAGWWTDPDGGKQVFASSAVTAYRLYSHWVELTEFSVDNPTGTSCEVCVSSFPFDQIGDFTLVVPSKLNGLSITGIDLADEFSVQARITSVSLSKTIKNLRLPGCSALRSLSIPNSVTSLFLFGCSSLSSLVIPNSVKEIPYSCFEGCSSLANIALPSSVTSIGDNAFDNCTSLESVTIPKSVTSVGYVLFYNCPKLKIIRLQNGSPLAHDDGENGTYYDFAVPDGCTVVRY